MRYLIKFWDKHHLIVSDKVATQIKIAKEKKIECIKIENALYEMKSISYIEPLTEQQNDNLLPEKIESPVKKETLEKIKKELVNKFNWNL